MFTFYWVLEDTSHLYGSVFELLVMCFLGFKARVDRFCCLYCRFHHLYVTDSSDSPLVWHLLTSWWPVWQPISLFHVLVHIKALVGPELGSSVRHSDILFMIPRWREWCKIHSMGLYGPWPNTKLGVIIDIDMNRMSPVNQPLPTNQISSYKRCVSLIIRVDIAIILIR